MHRQGATLLPGILNNGGFTQVVNLLDDVKFYKSVQPLFYNKNSLQFILVHAAHVFDMPDRIINQTNLFVGHSRRYTPTLSDHTPQHCLPPALWE
jgi:hypothetical protein